MLYSISAFRQRQADGWFCAVTLPPASTAPHAHHAAVNTVPPGPALIVVFNLGSGRGAAEEVRKVLQDGCAAAGRELQLLEVKDAADLHATGKAAVARAQACGGIVVAAGGDGTINAVAQQTLGSGCPFGVLPQGTFNYFGRANGIPEDAAGALQVLLDDHRRPAQVGLVNGKVFLVNASLGLYPKLLQDREEWKQQFGRSRFVALGAALATLLRGHRSLRLRIEAQGQLREMRTPTLFVGNNQLQLQQLGFPEADAVCTGQLAAIALRPIGKLTMLLLFLRGAFGRLADADDVIHVATQRLTVNRGPRGGTLPGRRIKVATDGEVQWMRFPIHFEVAPKTLELLCPAPEAAGDTTDCAHAAAEVGGPGPATAAVPIAVAAALPPAAQPAPGSSP